MNEVSKTLYTAEFNPKIKSYLIWYSLFLSIVMVITIPLIPIMLILAPSYVNKYYERLHCELTTRSLKFNKGYLFRTEKTIPLDKIQDLTFKEGPLLKAFGLSILRIETAGNSAAGAPDLTLIGIVDATAFRDRVFEQRDLVTDNKKSIATSNNDDETMLKVLTDIRDSLSRIEKMKS